MPKTVNRDEELVFKIMTPAGVTLEIPADRMPAGWAVWDLPTAEIARSAAEKLGLAVTVERTEIVTVYPDPIQKRSLFNREEVDEHAMFAKDFVDFPLG